MKDLILLFLKLGFTGFGGPPAHLEMMRREVVVRRRWLTEQELLDAIGAANLIPGPNSTEVVMHIGYRRDGWKGLLAAGSAFILPAACITGLLAYLYVRYGAQPVVLQFADGLKAGILALMIVSGVRLSRPAVKNLGLALVGFGSAIFSLFGAPEAIVLVTAGILSVLIAERTQSLAVSPLPVFIFFLQIGATIYGGGFVLVSYLQTGLVDQLGWLTRDQLLNAIAVGQVTPGPVFSTATFVGYVLGGGPGAVAATAGIFLPSFLLVGLLGRIAAWMRRTPRASRFLDGITVSSVALIFAAAIKLAPAAVTSPIDGALVAAAFLVGMATRLNPGLVVVACGLIRLALR